MAAFLWRNAKEKRNGNDVQLKTRERIYINADLSLAA
jgi:hypothetical protein